MDYSKVNNTFPATVRSSGHLGGRRC